MTPIIENAIVRIYDQNQIPIGAGFLVAPNQVITCAHVVSDSLNLGEEYTDHPEGGIFLDFPLIAPGALLPARVSGWRRELDVALLDIIEPLPNDASHLTLNLTQNISGHEFHAYGVPYGIDQGIWSFGTILRRNDRGHIQIQSTSYYNVERGFSGTLVWDKTTEEVVGIISEVDRNVRLTNTAYFIPVEILISAFPHLLRVPNKLLKHSFKYACFISYPEDAIQGIYIKTFVKAFHNALSKVVGALLGNKPIFLPPEQTDNKLELAKALCESASMIMIFTPKYFDKDSPLCACEYKAMEELEQTRLDLLNSEKVEVNQLIIPVLLFSERLLPLNVLGQRRIFNAKYKAREIVLAKEFPEYDPFIIEIAEEICGYYLALERCIDNPCGECSEFTLPAQEEIQVFLNNLPNRVTAPFVRL